jgi:glycosyltransferase involved in cell wall biosynthesis
LNHLSLILPAMDEAPALTALLPRLLVAHPDAEIIVVDAGCADDTCGLCKGSGVECLSSPYSMGNGAAIKRGARAASGDIMVFMDGDGQHDPANIKRLLDQLDRGYDMVVGARDWDSQAGVRRGLANTLYNWLATRMTGHPVLDLASGLRAVCADKFREFLHLLPNGFSYPTTSIMAFFRSAYPVAYLQIKAAQRIGKSHIRPPRRAAVSADHLQDRHAVLATEIVRAGECGVLPAGLRELCLDVRAWWSTENILLVLTTRLRGCEKFDCRSESVVGRSRQGALRPNLGSLVSQMTGIWS